MLISLQNYDRLLISFQKILNLLNVVMRAVYLLFIICVSWENTFHNFQWTILLLFSLVCSATVPTLTCGYILQKRIWNKLQYTVLSFSAATHLFVFWWVHLLLITSYTHIQKARKQVTFLQNRFCRFYQNLLVMYREWMILYSPFQCECEVTFWNMFFVITEIDI